MKAAINQLTRKIIKSDLVWKGLWPFIKTSNYLQYHRGVVKKEGKQQEHDHGLARLLGEPVVKNGPFRGMKYPAFASFGSAIFPKIIGSYECELHPLLEKISTKEYTTIFDVGSAEGYYAVGLALRFPGTPVYAYDVNEIANEACKEMATLNGVEQQVQVKSWCSAEIMGSFDFGARGLIVCDCEGFEKELFTKQSLENLKTCDLLIETHDFINIYISDYLKDLFSNTHHITSVLSLDDIVKARNYQFPELASLPLEQKKEIVAEKRPAIMEWLYLEPK